MKYSKQLDMFLAAAGLLLVVVAFFTQWLAAAFCAAGMAVGVPAAKRLYETWGKKEGNKD